MHYDETNWMLLKLALTENHELFPPETRASLVDDVFSLAEIGLMKYDTAFEFIKYMQMKERHYLPWGAFMRHMFKLNRLLYETPVFTDFQASNNIDTLQKLQFQAKYLLCVIQVFELYFELNDSSPL